MKNKIKIKEFRKWIKKKHRLNFEIERYVEDLLKEQAKEILREIEKRIPSKENDSSISPNYFREILISPSHFRNVLTTLKQKYEK